MTENATWMIHVLKDLKTFSDENDLPETSERLSSTISILGEELSLNSKRNLKIRRSLQQNPS